MTSTFRVSEPSKERPWPQPGHRGRESRAWKSGRSPSGAKRPWVLRTVHGKPIFLDEVSLSANQLEWAKLECKDYVVAGLEEGYELIVKLVPDPARHESFASWRSGARQVLSEDS